MILTFAIHINKKTNRKRQGTNDTYFLNSKDQNTLSKKKKKKQRPKYSLNAPFVLMENLM